MLLCKANYNLYNIFKYVGFDVYYIHTIHVFKFFLGATQNHRSINSYFYFSTLFNPICISSRVFHTHMRKVKGPSSKALPKKGPHIRWVQKCRLVWVFVTFNPRPISDLKDLPPKFCEKS
jgi:hypothetical protein